MTYNIILISGVQHSDLYAVQNGHHDMYHLSPYAVITALLSIFSLLYLMSPWLVYFTTESLCLLRSFTHTLKTIFRQLSVFFLYVYGSVSLCFICSYVLFFRFIQVKSYFLSLCLIYSTYKHSALKVHPCSCNGKIYSLWLSNILVYVCVYMHTISSLFSSYVYRHLGCFHMLAICCRNIGLHIFFEWMFCFLWMNS